MQRLEPNEIRAAFVNCSRGVAKNITLPPGFNQLSWDDRDFLGWQDPKIPARAYIVAPHGERLIGMLLRAADSSTRRKGSGLCNFCYSARIANDIVLFAAPRAGASGRQGNTVGTYICADLCCSLQVRGLVKLPLPQPEKAEPEIRAGRLRERLAAFIDRMLEQ